MNSSDYPTAAETFRETLKLTPDNPKLHFNLGTALKESARLEVALYCFETDLQLDPGLNKAFAKIFRIRQNL